MSGILYVLYSVLIAFVLLFILGSSSKKKIKPHKTKDVQKEDFDIEEIFIPKAPVQNKGCSVILKEVPTDKQIAIISVIHLATGLNLQDSKNLMESAPVTIKENISRDEANYIKELLKQAQAKVVIKGENGEEDEESHENADIKKLKTKKKKTTSNTKKTKSTTNNTKKTKNSTKKAKVKGKNND